MCSTSSVWASSIRSSAVMTVVNELRERRILISASGAGENVLKVRPPLPFGPDHATQVLGELDEVLASAPPPGAS